MSFAGVYLSGIDAVAFYATAFCVHRPVQGKYAADVAHGPRASR